MKGYIVFRIACLTLLWIALCYLLIAGRGLTPWTLFIIIISGGIVFVPIYKKYFRDGNGNASKQ